MYCKNCGELISNDQTSCIKCGMAIGNGAGYCSNCGNVVADDAAVCLKCGVAVNNGISGGNQLNGKDKLHMALWAIFLGGFGIHNFLMGETKKGIIKLVGSLCLGPVGSLLGTYDFVKIVCDRYVADPNAWF